MLSGSAGRIFIVLGCLTLGTFMGLAVSWRRSDRASRAVQDVGLTVQDEALDFGEVWEQESFEWVVPIRNVTGGDIRVLDIKTSCGCGSVDPKQFVVPAGGQAGVFGSVRTRL